jgi:putative membrane protein
VKEFFQRWVIDTVAVMTASLILPGIGYDGFGWLLLASLILGMFNAILKPLLLLLSLPLIILTLGLFSLVINALLLYFVGQIIAPFHVHGFGSALLGALIISIVSIALNTLTGTGGVRIDLRKPRRRKEPDDSDVIDV